MQFAPRRVLTIALVVAFSSHLDAQADVPLKPVDLKALNEHTFTPVLRDASGTDADSVQLTKGAHLYRDGKSEEAAREFNIVIKRSPHNAEALFDMAVVRQAGKDLSSATDYYRRACEENRDKRKYADALKEAQRQMHIAVLCNIAANAIKSGDLKNALSVYQQLDGVVHDAAIVKYDIGALYLKNNDPSSAKPYFLQAATLKPSDVDYKKALDECTAAQASSTSVASSSSGAPAVSLSNSTASNVDGSASSAASLSSGAAKSSAANVSSVSSGTSSSPDTSSGANNEYSLSNGLRAKTLSLDNVSFTDSASSKDKVTSENKIASAAPAGSTNAAAAAISTNAAPDSSTNAAAASSTNAAPDSSTNAAAASSAKGTQATSSSGAASTNVGTSSSGLASTGSAADGASTASSTSSSKSEKSSSGDETSDSSKSEPKPFYKVDPAETIGLNNSGVKALMKGDYETAIKNFKLALEKDPRYKLAENNLAIAYNNLGLQSRGTPDKALYQFHQAFFLARTNRTTAENIAGMIKIKGLDPNKAEDRDKLAKEELANNDAIGFHIESDAADWLRNNPGRVWTDGVVKPPQEPPTGIFGPYMAELQKRIKHHWYPPKGKETERVVVAFKISADGSSSNLHLKKSSSLVDVDQAALKAVENSRFAPLPEGAPASVDVEFTFDYNIFKGKNLLKRKDGDANQSKDSQSKDSQPKNASPTKNGNSSQAKDASTSSHPVSQPQGKGGNANQSKDAQSSQGKSGNAKKAKPKPVKSSVNNQ